MWQSKSRGEDVADKLLLFLDESVITKKEKAIAFNLQRYRQLRFTKPETQFAASLRENIEKFFRLK
jgi:hypothetical protein